MFEQLKASQKDYTTAWAAEKCDIDQEVIEALAEKTLPAVLPICAGYGGSDSSRTPISGVTPWILTALTGRLVSLVRL